MIAYSHENISYKICAIGLCTDSEHLERLQIAEVNFKVTQG